MKLLKLNKLLLKILSSSFSLWDKGEGKRSKRFPFHCKISVSPEVSPKKKTPNFFRFRHVVSSFTDNIVKDIVLYRWKIYVEDYKVMFIVLPPPLFFFLSEAAEKPCKSGLVNMDTSSMSETC